MDTGIQERLMQLRQQLPAHVKLIAVSKTMPDALIMEAYAAGQRLFGENKAQELSAKMERLPKDIQWHFIGHLQTNKVKYIAPQVHMIESVDSLKLLTEINRQAAKNNRIIRCLLQFHIAEEDTKFGLDLPEAQALLEAIPAASLHNVRICGVMGMATFTEDFSQVRREFRQLKSLFDTIKHKYFAGDAGFSEISMGMSGDFLIAIEEGSSMVRIGSSIFGERNYS